MGPWIQQHRALGCARSNAARVLQRQVFFSERCERNGLQTEKRQDCVSGISLRRAHVTVPKSLRAFTEQSVSKDNGKQGVFCSEIVPCGMSSAAWWAGRSAGVTEHAHCCFPTEWAPAIAWLGPRGMSSPYDRQDHACL
ncbi:unnamed protein product [Lota lota]